jgi:LuxR family transcriptional regulator, quorum-sensing system regulator SolR
MVNPRPLNLLCDAYDAMERARTSGELRAEIGKFARQSGFEHFAYALSISAPSLKPQHYFINGFPPEWHERYLTRGYFEIDPVVLHTRNSPLPTMWHDQALHTSNSREFWEEAQALGLRDGMSFAVHGQLGVTGILSLARDKEIEIPAAEMAALIGRAQMFASMLHHAVVRIELPKLLPERSIAMTPRERECLKWSADGKTAWEIGQILNITERTVVFHMNNVIQKLGASNKTQAIVRAVTLSLL